MSRLASYLVSTYAALSVVLVFHLAWVSESKAKTLPPRFEVAEQEQDQPLSFGQPVQREIRGGEVHTFDLSLLEKQYARVILRRRGIDLTLKITGPNNSAALTFENPAGPQSPIFALVSAETAGHFRIEVRPVKKWLAQGNYEIQVVEATTPDDRDQRRLLAQQKVSAGRRFQLTGTPDSLRAALVEYETALGLWRELQDRFEEANTLQFAGQTHRLLGDLPNADSAFQKSLKLREDDKKAWAYTKLDQAEAYYSLQDVRASLPLYEEAALSLKENADRRGEALARMQIALARMRQFDWEGAREALNTALNLSRSESDSYEEARALNALAGVYDNLGQPEQALHLYEQARANFHSAGDSVREGNVCNNIGVLYDLWGEQRDAIDNYNQALSLLDAGLAAGDADKAYVNSKKASLFYNLGSLYVALESYPQAFNYLQKSLDLRDPKDRGPTLMWIAYAHILMGEPQRALQYGNQALELQEPQKSPRRAQTYTVIGMAQHQLNNYPLALEYFDKALEIQQNPKTLDLRGQSITLDQRGVTLAATGAVAKAREDFERALAEWRKFKDRNGEAMTLFQLARLERQAGNVDAGLEIAERAIKLIEPLRKNVAAQLRASYFATKVDYYELYIDLIMLSRKSENAAVRNAAALEASEQARARALLDSLALGSVDSTETKDPGLAQLIQQRKLYRRTILAKSALRSRALLSNSTKSQIDSLDRELENLDREQEQLEKKIRSQFPQYSALISADPATAAEIQQQLDADTLLLEFALGERRSYAWTVTNSGVHGYELPPRQQIEDAAARLLRALNAQKRLEGEETLAQQQARLANAEKEYGEAVATLRRMLLDPLYQQLDRRRLVIVADGALQLIPFAVLPDPKDPVANLISNYEIVSLPSASVLALQRRELANRKPAPLSLAVVADPVFDIDDDRVVRALSQTKGAKKKLAVSNAKPPAAGHASPSEPKVETLLASALRDVGLDPNSLGRLQKSGEEAADISSIVPNKESFTAIGFQATRALVMSGKLDKYRNVHFATHGVLDLEHPELSGIVLSRFDENGKPQDGYLRLYEIYNLNLPADLVVLSACQTGSGKQVKGEGLMALTRGFMYAGAARVVATLWKVDDSASAALMTRFYKEMFTNGKRPAAALRDAQIELSKEKRWKSPFYWAGFVLQGEWR